MAFDMVDHNGSWSYYRNFSAYNFLHKFYGRSKAFADDISLFNNVVNSLNYNLNTGSKLDLLRGWFF